jgi:tetratricopeptide (TPR) repeat protein
MELRILIPAFLAGFIILGLAGAAPVLADNQKAIEYYNTGVELAYQGDYNQALEQIDLALSENRNQEALAAADEAIAQNQSLPYAWVNKATALINLGQPDAALAASDQAIAIDPTIPEAWVDKGSALLDLGRYQESVQASRQALQLDPNSREALANYQAAQVKMSGGAKASPSATSAPMSPWCGIAALGLAGTAALWLRRTG